MCHPEPVPLRYYLFPEEAGSGLGCTRSGETPRRISLDRQRMLPLHGVQGWAALAQHDMAGTLGSP